MFSSVIDKADNSFHYLSRGKLFVDEFHGRLAKNIQPYDQLEFWRSFKDVSQIGLKRFVCTLPRLKSFSDESERIICSCYD